MKTTYSKGFKQSIYCLSWWIEKNGGLKKKKTVGKHKHATYEFTTWFSRNLQWETFCRLSWPQQRKQTSVLECFLENIFLENYFFSFCEKNVFCLVIISHFTVIGFLCDANGPPYRSISIGQH